MAVGICIEMFVRKIGGINERHHLALSGQAVAIRARNAGSYACSQLFIVERRGLFGETPAKVCDAPGFEDAAGCFAEGVEMICG